MPYTSLVGLVKLLSVIIGPKMRFYLRSKAAVDKSCRYEPQVNMVFKDFALHYQTVILPTRAYKPKDKAKWT